MSGLSAREFARRVAAGDIKGEVREGNRVWYNPEDVMALTRKSDEQLVLRDLVKMFGDGLRSAQAHTEKLLATVEGPARAVQEHYQGLIAKQSERIGELEDRWFKSMELFEQVVTAEHERALESRRAEQAEQRRGEAWELVKRHGPTVLRQALGSRQVAEFMQSLSPEQVQSLLVADGFFTDEQKEALRAIVKRERESNGTADTGRAGDEDRAGADGGPGTAGPSPH